ncbi:YcjF family protein [Nitrospirillum bahiense]|uniref:Uncharacterized protein (DUF697 family) n=1 Tax=Nitrospirillum amazonense TaxID=28077 RepID=A0A560EUE0_9PROT|nr:DUF697 domain-containing protein [Nitrospirillum amazonense]TWB12895.1 uncharacterized protein (DUF697 family) [Nitrospirillum amazonense]
MVTKKEITPEEAAAAGPEAVSPTATTTEAPADAVAADTTHAAVAVADDVAVRHIIRTHVLLAAGSAVIPVVLLDDAVLAGVQLNLLRELAKHYSVDFRGDIGKAAIGTLLATVAPATLGGSLLGSFAFRHTLKAIPLVGPVLGLLTQPAFNAAFTYALGKVFAQHFASGGTFLTFDPAKVTDFFKEKFNEVRGKSAQAAAAVA